MDELVFRLEPNAAHHGRICVKYTDNDLNEPRYYVLYWPASHVMFDRDAFDLFPEI
jgi:hypothetical protein